MPPPPPPRNPQSRNPIKGLRDQKPNADGKPAMPKWAIWAIIGAVVVLAFGSQLFATPTGEKLSYTEFLAQVRSGDVSEVTINNQRSHHQQLHQHHLWRARQRREVHNYRRKHSQRCRRVPPQANGSELRLQHPTSQLAHQPSSHFLAVPSHCRILHVDATSRHGPSRKHHVCRAQQGQDIPSR